MKKVLVVTYYFPPLGLGGTQRIAKFVKYLPQFGWRPTVVTVKPIAYWALDESLLQDVADAKVVRTESLDPQRLMMRLGKSRLQPASGARKGGVVSFVNQKISPYLLAPDSKILWRPFALRTVKRLVQKENFDALFTTSPPHSVHLIGKAIAGRYRLKWLADFRDGWAGSHVVHEPGRRSFERNLRLQQKVVQAADAVIAVSPGVKDSLLVSSSASQKFHLLTNGFDPDDFNEKKRRSDRFVLVYSGTINKFADPGPFLDALQLLKERRPSLYQKLRVQFVGYDTLGSFAEMTTDRNLENVQVVGHKTHAESVNYLIHADALLLIAKARRSDTFIPGKTFEYIGAQKPVFAISNSKQTNDLLSKYPLATIVNSFNSEHIYNRLGEFLARDSHSIKIDEHFVRQFDRRVQTEQLAEILNSITQRN